MPVVSGYEPMDGSHSLNLNSMKCPICNTDHNIKSFRVDHCPKCDYDGSSWNAIYYKNSNE